MWIDRYYSSIQIKLILPHLEVHTVSQNVMLLNRRVKE